MPRLALTLVAEFMSPVNNGVSLVNVLPFILIYDINSATDDLNFATNVLSFAINDLNDESTVMMSMFF